MTVPYRLVKGVAAGRDETCVRCGSRSTRLVVDHCHQHGYARGLLCGPCNSRMAVLDAGTAVPTPKEAFHLDNCPECRKGESLDSPHALALSIGSVALAVAAALDLSPRQAAALALSLAESENPGERREAPGREQLGVRDERREPARRETSRPLPESKRDNLSAAVRSLAQSDRSRDEIRAAVRAMPGFTRGQAQQSEQGPAASRETTSPQHTADAHLI